MAFFILTWPVWIAWIRIEEFPLVDGVERIDTAMATDAIFAESKMAARGLNGIA
jgi:hypothetical protein